MKKEKRRRENINIMKKMLYYYKYASKIQKIWRGYWCRKKILNFYKRQEYINGIKETSKKIRQELSDYEELRKFNFREIQKEKELLEISRNSKKYHFLKGTKNIPGVLDKQAKEGRLKVK